MMRIKKNYILWMKTIHYPIKIRAHLVTIVPIRLVQSQLQS